MVRPERQAWLEGGNIAHADTKPRTGPEHLGTPSGQPGIPAPELGLSRFCSEKAKKLLRNIPKSCSKVAQN